MSSATDAIRAMLDERGVEWWQSANTLGCIFTRWYSPLFGDEVVAMENGEEGLVLFDHFVTPEQAIEATLGRGECEQEEHGWSTEGDHARVWLTCGHDCMVETVADLPNYCPNCGRKVMQ